MKKFISKIKKSCRNFINGKAAFSLVELIVVIAIMAVMAAVLAPALLGYVERSRAQKDDSALDEVVNSIQLSLADQDVYDEMLKYSAEQYSCYVDSDSPDEANKIDIKTGRYFMYNDNERQLDETIYKLDGVMRGVTITFAPDAAASNSATLDLVKGHVNKYLPSGKKTYGGLTGANASPQLSTITDSELYNSLRATIGDKIAISSQTYRNSEYTIFIAMGTTGGNQADMQDAIKVWGQWSGTNLPEGSSVATNGANVGTNAGSNEFQGSTPVSLPAKGKTLEEYTWAEVQQIVQAGAAAEYGFVVGSTKTLQINNATHTATIIGLNHDGSNTATFMIVSSDGIGYHVMNTDFTNAGGWKDSEMRTWLNTTIYESMTDTKAYIKEVTKMTNNTGYNGTAATSTSDKVFLLSAKEAGVADDIYSASWDWYPEEYKPVLETEGTTYTWLESNTVGTYFWLRSPESYYDFVFFYYTNGNLEYNRANNDNTVCPAFVIG